MASDEQRDFRVALLKKDKLELVKILKSKKQTTNGSKADLVDRILAYDEKTGGKMARKASAAASNTDNDGEIETQTSKKKKKKASTKDGRTTTKKKKSQKSGGVVAGGGTKKRKQEEEEEYDEDEDEYDEDDNDNNSPQIDCTNCNFDFGGGAQNGNIAGIIGIVCVFFYIIAMGVDELSHADIGNRNAYCGWSSLCSENDNGSREDCVDDAFEDACDFCRSNDLTSDTEQCDNTCSTWSGGQAWLAFNIIGMFLCLFGVLAIFSPNINCQFPVDTALLRSKAFVLYIISAICAIIAICSFVGANDYDGGCYGDDNVDLGTSNVFDIIIVLLLCVAVFFAFK